MQKPMSGGASAFSPIGVSAASTCKSRCRGALPRFPQCRCRGALLRLSQSACRPPVRAETHPEALPRLSQSACQPQVRAKADVGGAAALVPIGVSARKYVQKPMSGALPRFPRSACQPQVRAKADVGGAAALSPIGVPSAGARRSRFLFHSPIAKEELP